MIKCYIIKNNKLLCDDWDDKFQVKKQFHKIELMSFWVAQYMRWNYLIFVTHDNQQLPAICQHPHSLVVRESSLMIIRTYFHWFGPTALGRFSHRVAMSVCLFVCLCVCAIGCSFFQGLSLALRSQDQFQASHWSSLPPSFGNLETWKLGNLETR